MYASRSRALLGLLGRSAWSRAHGEPFLLNRRVEIVIVPDLSSLPGFEELNEAVAKPAS
jgi:hypothetical protein